MGEKRIRQGSGELTKKREGFRDISGSIPAHRSRIPWTY
ncbi:hypothetical protein ASZ90_016632 [hydrocarbon metagenome]|uniref:Uncharacterized protein n=1 Tax=hydrocarbon metagenome TaxID=938273 RepID=A0A0W8ELE5_9ZZZZ